LDAPEERRRLARFRLGLAGFLPLGLLSFISEWCLGGIRPSAPIRRLVSSSWSWLFVMSESEDTWPKPQYNAGGAKHLHAIGVISMNYNAFERSLHRLFLFHLERKKVPRN
jgi:hypothetical protein